MPPLRPDLPPSSRAAAALLLALTLPGCTLTKALWEAAEPPITPPVETVEVTCRVESVSAARADDADGPDGILLRYRAEPSADGPSHLRGPGAGWLLLQPPGIGDWRRCAGADRFAVDDWDLRVTNGSYFKTPWANALLRFRGTVAPAAIGRVVDDRAPADWTPLAPANGFEAACADAFAGRDWLAILAPALAGPHRRAVPVAWVDAGGQQLARRPAVAGSGDAGDLLGVVEDAYGNRHWVQVALAVLWQADDLDLARDGDTVRFERSQIWRATLLDDAAAAARAAADPLPPMATDRFAYRWGREVEPGALERTVVVALRDLVTPVTVALDLAIETAPPLARLIHDLFGDEGPELSRPGSGGR